MESFKEITVKELVTALSLTPFTPVYDGSCSGAYASDLLSDVMGNSSENQVWVTLQTHLNVVAIASLKDIPALIFVNNHTPDEEVIKKAKEDEITLLGTAMGTFEMCGKLYSLLNK